MANSTLKISFKLEDGANGLKQLTVDAEALRKVMGACTTETEKFKKEVSYLANTSFAIDAVANSLQQLNAYLTDLTDAMAVQQVAETQLAVTMRNSMMATDAQVQAIKDLCSAQQQIGVVGDEVQLAGAQKMATFLKEEESMRKLIPAMNDMLVAQNGLKSTQENAVSVATLFAKAMEGQTTSFKRMGWELSAAQEQILKYGTEQQKVAVIADLVKSKVGGMNEALAQTESGQIQQKQNMAGDWKEQWGSLAAAIAPTVTLLASATVAIGGFLKVTMSINTAVKALTTFTYGTKIATSSLRILGITAVQGSGFFNTLTKSFQAAKASGTALSFTLKGLLATTGIGLAIWALIEIFNYFTSSADKATDATNDLIDATKRAEAEEELIKRSREEASSSIEQERAALEINISTLKNFNGTKAEEKKLVSEMNSKYGETMGYFSSVSDWYNTLISNSADYCAQMEIEAETRAIANRIAKRKEQQRQITHDEYGNQRRYNSTKPVRSKHYIDGKDTDEMSDWEIFKYEFKPRTPRKTVVYHGDSDKDKAQAAYDDLEAKNAADRKRMQQLAEEKSGINYRVRGSDVNPSNTPASPATSKAKDNTPVFREEAETLRGVRENVRYYQTQLEDATKEEAAAINANIALWKEKEDAIVNAGKAAKVEKGDVLIKDPKTIEEMDNNLEYYNRELRKATSKEIAAEINVQKKAVEDLKKSYEEAGVAAEDMAPKLNPEATRLSDIEGNIAFWQKQLDDASVEEAAGINFNIALWEEKARAIRDAGKEVKATFDTYTSGWGAVKGIGSGVDSVTRALQDNGNAWQQVTGIVDGFLQVYEGIKGIVDMINALTDATRAAETATVAAAAAKAQENATTAAGTTVTAANTASTIAGATAIDSFSAAIAARTGAKALENATTAAGTAVTIADTAATVQGTAATVADTSASIANTAAKQGESIANATASGAKLPFPANLAAIAAGIAAVVAAFSMAGGFATGGIVGGSSITGDKLLARVNSGEMILNKDQQRNLFKMLNAPLRTPNITAAGAPRIEFSPDSLFANRREEIRLPRIMGRISGRDIVLAAANETRVASRSGRHSNIKI